MDLGLAGKRAIVCGSTDGIGKASAFELADMGAEVVLLARNESKLKSVRDSLPKLNGQRHSFLVADFSIPDQVRAVMEQFTKQTTAHILVNNTAGPSPGAAIDASPDDFMTAFSAHLLCNQILTQAVVPGMKHERYGRIINIISTSVKIPIKGLGVSNTIRGAVANWAKTLSLELAPFGITVNNVLPGATMTNRLRDLIATKAKQGGKTLEDVQRQMESEIPVGRISDPSEIAAAVAFLATPAASYINGISLPVDGGRTGSL